MAYSVPNNLMPPRIQNVYNECVAITPADNTQIGPWRALYVGVTGNVTLCPLNSATVVTFEGVPAGTVLPVAFQGVNATGTTATNLVGLG